MQETKLIMFQKFSKMLVCAAAGAACTMIYIAHLFLGDPSEAWKSEWFYTEGVPHLLFLALLMTMMYLFAPGKLVQTLGYSSVADVENVEDAK